jgi:exodeoxyribonuclease-5
MNVVLKNELDEDGNPVLDPNGNQKKKLEFKLKDKLPDNIKLIYIDEYSMCNDEIINDILSFGIPTIFAGDMNQLPPVFGTSTLLENPDFRLTKIMRQAEGNPIIYLSQRALHGFPLNVGNYGKSNVYEWLPAEENLVRDYDVMLCSLNRTRDNINNYIRKYVLHIDSDKPLIGERVINRRNDWDRNIDGFYLVNGMSGILTDIDYTKKGKKFIKASFKPDFLEDEFVDLKLDIGYLQSSYAERKCFGLSKYNLFEYAYCLNVHVSQGSQYNRVLFLDEPSKFDPETKRKLRYTAITRAIESIDIVVGRIG